MKVGMVPSLYPLALTGALVTAAIANAAQVPLQSSGRSSFLAHSSWAGVAGHVDLNHWRLDTPRRNNTSNFIFDGVSGLLQQWANTRYRNGHIIIPGTIPAGTLLYHGTSRNATPSVPEWLATDPEHAHLFCRELSPNTGCYLLTVAPVRPLNILYFDGSAAAKMYGAMDTQDVLIWGNVVDTGDRVYNEHARIKWFCSWIQKMGYELDGIVRMEPDFEIMLCDFSSPALSTVSFSHLNPGWRFGPSFPAPRKPLPPGQRPLVPLHAYRALEAGMWHNDFPGETRVQLDLTRMISFYDEETFPSLVEARRGKDRWEHRVGNVTVEEQQTLMDKVDKVLTSTAKGSGVDWTSMHRVIVHRYSERLEILQYLLTNATRHETQSVDRLTQEMNHIHDYVRGIIAQCILYSAQRPSAHVDGKAPPHAWAAPIFEQCATAYTSSMSYPSSPLAARMTESERLLQKGVEGVLHEICRVLVGIWAEAAELGLGESLQGSSSSPTFEPVQEFSKLRKVAKNWLHKVESLIEWLDWSVWVKCKPACGEEEMCYLPTWPFIPHRAEPPWPHWPPKLDLNATNGDTHNLLSILSRDREDNGVFRKEGVERLNARNQMVGKQGKHPDMFQKPVPMCMRRMNPYQIPYDLEWGF